MEALCSKPLLVGPLEESMESVSGSFIRQDAHCHGLLVRCGDTKIHVSLSGLYRLCDISSRIASGMLFCTRNVQRRRMSNDVKRGPGGVIPAGIGDKATTFIKYL